MSATRCGAPEDPPDDLEIRTSAADPFDDPTMGVASVPVPGAARTPDAPHRLVVIGDSVSHGVNGGAVWRTELAWPALLARALDIDDFRRPEYGGPGPGLPLNLESLLRTVSRRYGARLSWTEVVGAGLMVRREMDAMEDYWERGPGAVRPAGEGPILHNLSVLGFDLRNALALNADEIEKRLAPPRDDVFRQVPEQGSFRAGLQVLGRAVHEGRSLTQFEAARQLGSEGDPGIGTLVVMLGANNALGALTRFCLRWSGDGYDDVDRKSDYTVWRPTHFEAEWSRVVEELRTVQAGTVVVSTVPHVTIAPIARGLPAKVRPGSRYFAYYTWPWIRDDQFDPRRRSDPYLTADQARQIDSAIDQYNRTIAESVRAARAEGRRWLLFDLCTLLDRLAHRRYLADPATERPRGWTPYPLPAEVLALQPVPDTRFFGADENGRTQGGMFSLDGFHPTVLGQGLIAHDMLRVLQAHAGAPERAHVDFRHVIESDSLLSDPPSAMNGGLELLGWLDQTLDVVRHLGGTVVTAAGQVDPVQLVTPAAVLLGSSPGATRSSRLRLSALRALRTLLQAVAAIFPTAGVGSEILSASYWEVAAYSLVGAVMTAVASFLQNAASFLPDDPSQRPVRVEPQSSA